MQLQLLPQASHSAVDAYFSAGTRDCSPDSEAIGVLTSSIRRVACLHFGAWLLVPLQSAAAGCAARSCCRSDYFCFGAWLLVPLLHRGAAARCRCKALLSDCYCALELACRSRCKMPLLQGGSARCCCQSPVCALELVAAARRYCYQGLVCALKLGCWCRSQGAAVRAVCGLERGYWCCRRVLLQGVAARCCCQRAVCALGLGCWCWWWWWCCCCCCRAAECRRRVPLQGAAFRVLFVLWSLVADAATGCRQRVPLQDVPARCLFWSLVAGAAARCRHRVRLSEWCLCFGT